MLGAFKLLILMRNIFTIFPGGMNRIWTWLHNSDLTGYSIHPTSNLHLKQHLLTILACIMRSTTPRPIRLVTLDPINASSHEFGKNYHNTVKARRLHP